MLSWSALAMKASTAMLLAATTDAVVGAVATVAVGALAAISSIAVALIQTRRNRARDEAVDEAMKLTRQISDLEHDRAAALEDELRQMRDDHRHHQGDTDAPPE